MRKNEKSLVLNGESRAEKLDKKLSSLRELIQKENTMLRKMIKSLDALEKKIARKSRKKPQQDKNSGALSS